MRPTARQLFGITAFGCGNNSRKSCADGAPADWRPVLTVPKLQQVIPSAVLSVVKNPTVPRFGNGNESGRIMSIAGSGADERGITPMLGTISHTLHNAGSNVFISKFMGFHIMFITHVFYNFNIVGNISTIITLKLSYLTSFWLIAHRLYDLLTTRL